MPGEAGRGPTRLSGDRRAGGRGGGGRGGGGSRGCGGRGGSAATDEARDEEGEGAGDGDEDEEEREAGGGGGGIGGRGRGGGRRGGELRLDAGGGGAGAWIISGSAPVVSAIGLGSLSACMGGASQRAMKQARDGVQASGRQGCWSGPVTNWVRRQW